MSPTPPTLSPTSSLTPTPPSASAISPSPPAPKAPSSSADSSSPSHSLSPFTGPAAPVVAPLPPTFPPVSVAFTVSIPAPLASPVTITYGAPPTAPRSPRPGLHGATGGTVTITRRPNLRNYPRPHPLPLRQQRRAHLPPSNLSNPSGGISLPITSQSSHHRRRLPHSSSTPSSKANSPTPVPPAK